MPLAPVLAVIPARGGSVGIPRKNLQLVGGVPLVGRAVRSALGAQLVDRVIVSTDDAAIADVARSFGAEVAERPPELSAANASSEAALVNVLDALGEQGGVEPAVCVMVQCTSPFTRSEDLDGVLETLEREQADCVFTASSHHGFLWRPTEDGVAPVNHELGSRPMRQDLAPEYLESGAAYAMRVAGLRRHRHRFFGRVSTYVVPRERAMEIDEPADLVLAQAIASRLDLGVAALALPDPLRAVVFDFDGVLTDNRVLTDEHGNESVSCDRSDGMGIEALREAGVALGVLSKERNPVVARRCEKLGLEAIQAVDDKWPVLAAWLERCAIPTDSVVYVGNDTNDAECLERVGCGVVVADAHPDVIRLAKLVLTRGGGHGAVRELADLVLAHRT